MSLCPHCGYVNRPGVMFCEECAREIYMDSRQRFDITKQLEDDAQDGTGANPSNPAYFSVCDTLVVYIRDVPDPVLLMPGEVSLCFGRTSEKSSHIPDVDLTPFDALSKGVSHLHATLCHSDNQLALMDMDSVNGTFINGQRLNSNQPYVLRDGDEIRFGRLVTQIYFQKPA